MQQHQSCDLTHCIRTQFTQRGHDLVGVRLRLRVRPVDVVDGVAGMPSKATSMLSPVRCKMIARCRNLDERSAIRTSKTSMRLHKTPS